MVFFIKLRRHKTAEKGAVMLEFGIGMLFLIPTLFTMLDVGLALNKYAKLARIAYEGTRFASTVAGLEGGTVENLGSNTTYTLPDNNTTTPDNFRQQDLVRMRLVELIVANGFQTNSANIKTKYSKREVPANSAQIDPDIIYVDIAIDYEPLTPFFAPITLAVSTRGPYLYRERT